MINDKDLTLSRPPYNNPPPQSQFLKKIINRRPYIV